MGNSLENLESLARLSKETGAEGRQKLLREVTDIFIKSPPGGLSNTEVDYFGDIMGRLAFDLETKVRKQLSETLSEEDAAPRELLTRLATDEVDVARPVLSKSTVLQDSDLLDIIKKCSQDHLLAITVRAKVSEHISDALVEKGNDTVLGSLAGNEGAELSISAMETMVTRSAGGDEGLQQALTHRQGMPEDLLREMSKHVSGALRDHILSLGIDIETGEMDQMLAEADDWLISGVGDDGSTSAEKYIIRKEKLNQLNPDLLVKLALECKVSEFTAGIAKMGKIDLTTARQAILDKSGEKLAVICKALEIETGKFSQIIDLLDPKGRIDDSDKKILVGVYGRITPESAQRAMRFLRTRQKLKSKAAPTQKNWGD